MVENPYSTIKGEGKAIGTEAFWIPAALAAASAGTQYVNQKDANARQQAGEVQTIMDEQKLQAQGNAGVKALTQQVAQNTPDQLAKKATGDYVSVLRKNAAGSQTGKGNSADILFGAPTSALPSSIGGSSRYKSGAADAQNQTEDYGTQLAGEMGNIDAATRQRQNEGLAASTLGTNLNLLGAESYTKNFADQLRAQASGQASPWLTLLSGALGGAANTMSKNAGGAKGGIPAGTIVGDGSINGGYGTPGSPATMPAVNPWFDTTGQT